MKGRWWVILLAILGLMAFPFFFMAGVCTALFSGKIHTGNVAVVEVEGGIFDSKEIVEQLMDVKKDPQVKGVVLRIDSPGGAIGASQEIFEAVKGVKENKPIVASMGSVAASGGYYVALPATRILANPGTITGSIGVRMDLVNLEELLRWARLQPVTLKSGFLKDVGSPTRAMTEEERAYLEGILAKLHDQFKKAVAESRNLTSDAVDRIADGGIFTGLEAVDKKLVDETGSFEKAVELVKGLAQIQGEPELFYPDSGYHKVWERLLSGAIDRSLARVWRMIASPTWLYGSVL